MSIQTLKKYVLPKKERLCSRTLIRQLFAEGKSVQSYPLKMLYLPCETLPSWQVLVSVPKRNFKRAVHRNRIKRLLRENYRLTKHSINSLFTGNYIIAFIYLGKEMPDFSLVENKMNACIEKWHATQQN
ncbi:MAG: ribonuclease P protein component [Capnocytophaga sp.]|nr:ribonuclease P protein component [Capnocytophaga sp.]